MTVRDPQRRAPPLPPAVFPPVDGGANDVPDEAHLAGSTGAPAPVEPPSIEPIAPARKPPARRFFIPEVIQSSKMDCGPAALKALLGGFGISVHYGRLREACRTSVDGTSIDTLEELAGAFGLDARQTVVPTDHVPLPAASALPALVVVKRPHLGNHFVVLWNRVGPYVQVMDPAAGRIWVRWSEFAPSTLKYRATVPTKDWRAWAESPAFLSPLDSRLRSLGVSRRDADALLDLARDSKGWLGLGALDAAVRFCASLQQAGIVRGSEARTVRAMVERVQASFEERFDLLPRPYWSVEGESPEGEMVASTGVLLVRARLATEVRAPGVLHTAEEGTALPKELQAALETRDERPEQELAKLLAGESRVGLALLTVGALVTPLGMICQTVLLRRLFDLAPDLGMGLQRVGAGVLVVGFLALLGALEAGVYAGMQRLGRVLEMRLRLAFIQKIPRLQDLYLQSRLSSDMAERSHMMHVVRGLPALAFTGARALVGLVATVVAIGMMDSRLWSGTIVLAVLSVVLPLAFRQRMTEQDMRARTQLGSLSRYYLDSLVGAVPLRAHGAQTALGREHEILLTGWMRSSLQLLRTMVSLRFVQATVGAALCITLLTLHLGSQGVTGGMLLVAYWIMGLPDHAQQLAGVIQGYPAARNVALRCMEPLGAPEVAPRPAAPAPLTDVSRTQATGISLHGVSVEVSGHRLLHDIDVDIAPGSHVAIVGSSGAGKSTLLGVLLGWYPVASGTVRLDGRPLEPSDIEDLRTRTAWVDPAVQLWNQSIAANLTYGQEQVGSGDMARALESADLETALQHMQGGLQTRTGENGLRLSGGEGQRLRLARALLRPGMRLALLDEPFRGLDRTTRRRLLGRAREHWKDTTLLCVTHDVSETQGFDAVVVIEDGRVVERGTPEALLSVPGSRYRALLEGEAVAQGLLHDAPAWRRWRLEGGRLVE
ncbi:ATP-binding cassette domain-containing protein [Corallococcus sp. bb12-1]|uniref:ATP-binding cassette domain-containing protein n=1 Tax=Corallococcus sp. bb12-1 TaxID=2996784 RepID=UPI00226F8EA8|nr:ATP-binding cassette domain-containing protein [Corallococcus sp. bb12-1]MCY1045471.1 ATP-binding cassette domain-containing protein [Corallococcus sp. bb12-1]